MNFVFNLIWFLLSIVFWIIYSLVRSIIASIMYMSVGFELSKKRITDVWIEEATGGGFMIGYLPAGRKFLDFLAGAKIIYGLVVGVITLIGILLLVVMQFAN